MSEEDNQALRDSGYLHFHGVSNIYPTAAKFHLSKNTSKVNQKPAEQSVLMNAYHFDSQPTIDNDILNQGFMQDSNGKSNDNDKVPILDNNPLLINTFEYSSHKKIPPKPEEPQGVQTLYIFRKREPKKKNRNIQNVFRENEDIKKNLNERPVNNNPAENNFHMTGLSGIDPGVIAGYNQEPSGLENFLENKGPITGVGNRLGDSKFINDSKKKLFPVNIEEYKNNNNLFPNNNNDNSNRGIFPLTQQENIARSENVRHNDFNPNDIYENNNQEEFKTSLKVDKEPEIQPQDIIQNSKSEKKDIENIPYSNSIIKKIEEVAEEPSDGSGKSKCLSVLVGILIGAGALALYHLVKNLDNPFKFINKLDLGKIKSALFGFINYDPLKEYSDFYRLLGVLIMFVIIFIIIRIFIKGTAKFYKNIINNNN